MPEIKRTFTAGKMNKDLDERIIRNGEYRDALNIQVRTTDGEDTGIGDSGTVQNIEGNVNIDTSSYKTIGYNLAASDPDTGNNTNITRFIGSVGDEKSDKAYFFAAAPLPEGGIKDINESVIMSSQIPESEYVSDDDEFDPHNNVDDATAQGKSPKIWVDTIMEVDVITETAEPIFIDKFMVTGRVFDILPSPVTVPPPGFTQLVVNDASIFRIGMKAYLQDINGEHLFFDAEGIRGVEIVNIQPEGFFNGVNYFDVLILASEQDVNLMDLYDDGLFNWQCAMKFIAPKVLEFNPFKLITSINIIDDLLFWTDGFTEPKKINITRSKKGTDTETYLTNPIHTKLFVSDPSDDTDIYPDDLVEVTELETSLTSSDIKRENITVIRKSPQSPPSIYMRSTDRDTEVDFSIDYTFINEEYDPVTPGTGDLRTIIDDVLIGLDIRENDVLIFTSEPQLGGAIVVLRAKVINFTGNTLVVEMMLVDLELSEFNPSFWNVNLQQKKALFETKFGRVGYRYKYEDGEYSTYSPWSELVFLPGDFSYTPSQGYNNGMLNNVRHLVIKDFIPDDSVRPSDVKSVDVLWKTTDDQNVYIIKTITREIDSEWEDFTDPEDTSLENTGSLTVTSEMIHRVLPANQLFRGWDNVPKTAIAQEITANRLVYGNYTQGYDIKRVIGLRQQVKSDLVAFPTPKKSVKSIRNYKFGMVFGDKYGRETPVIANGYQVVEGETITGDISVEKSLAHYSNKFKLKQEWGNNGTSTPLSWVDYVKYYVKETSNEYYNLVMDRWYDAGDGNIWLAFASVDRNKVDEETYLILKNEHGSQQPVLEKGRYKIIAIENEAPDFIKTDHRHFEKIVINRANVYKDEDGEEISEADKIDGIPSGLVNTIKIVTDEQYFPDDLDHSKFDGVKKVRIVGEYTTDSGATIYGYSPWRTVTRLKTQGSKQGCFIQEVFKSTEVNMYTKISIKTTDTINVSNVDNTTEIGDGGGTEGDYIRYWMEFKDEVVENKPQFDGRFFVKVQKDEVLDKYVLGNLGLENYEVASVYEVAYIANWDANPGLPNENNDTQPANLGPYNDPSLAGNGENGWPWPDEGSVFTTTGGDVEGSLQIDAWVNNLPNFGIGNSNATEDFWENWWNQGIEGGMGNTARTTRIFIDRAPCWRGYNLTINLDFNQTQAYTAISQANNFEIEGIPGVSMNQWVNQITTNTDTTYYWEAGFGQDDAHSVTGLLQYFGSGSEPLNSNDGDQNWQPAGFSYGACTNGEYGQITFSSIGPGVGSSFAPGSDTEFKSLMQTPGTIFRFANDPTDTFYKVKPITFLEVEETQPYFYTQHIYHGQTSDDWNPTQAAHAEIDGIGAIERTQSQWLGQFGENSPSPIDGYVTRGEAYWAGALPPNQGVVKEIFVMPPNVNGNQANIDAWIEIRRRVNVQVDPINQDSISVWNASNYAWTNSEDPLRKRHSIIVRFDKLDSNGGIISNSGIDVTQWDPRGEVRHDGIGSMAIQIMQPIDGGELSSDTIATDSACWETEPKEDIDVDVYYEASRAIPTKLNKNNIVLYTDPAYQLENACQFKIDSRTGYDGTMSIPSIPTSCWVFKTLGDDGVYITGGSDDLTVEVTYDNLGEAPAINDIVSFTHRDGLVTRTKILEHYKEQTYDAVSVPVLSDRYIANVDLGFMDTQIFGLSSDQLSAINDGDQVIGPGIQPATFVQNVTELPFGAEGWPGYVLLNKPIIAGSTGVDVTFIEVTGIFKIDKDVWKYYVDLGWFNCYSFGNAVESDRIRDDFNAPQIDNGVKVSSTFLEYGEERIGSGLIHSSELYNSISSVNGLNQFNMGEKITKNLNPIYGSIQALKTRDTNLVTFCEDKILKVLANKDAVFNADGNPQLTATNKVLGQTIPFVGDYGISKNPESLAWDQNRIYFADKQRGAVLRLSRDGLTPISNVGMKTYFREYLRMCDNIVGTFDVVNGEYNIKLGINEINQTEMVCSCTSGGCGCTVAVEPRTLSFNEGGKGWVSFKSFIHSCGVSVSGKYITAPATNHMPGLDIPAVETNSPLNKIWIHNASSVGRNNFYSEGFSSSVEMIFNDSPETVKSFKAMNYEGSQARITQNTDLDNEYYNLNGRAGWYVSNFRTDMQEGFIPEFINKENKWFNFIHGDTIDVNNLNTRTAELCVQGIGYPLLIGPTPTPEIPTPTPTQNGGGVDVSGTPNSLVPSYTLGLQWINLGPNATAPGTPFGGLFPSGWWNYDGLAYPVYRVICTAMGDQDGLFMDIGWFASQILDYPAGEGPQFDIFESFVWSSETTADEIGVPSALLPSYTTIGDFIPLQNYAYTDVLYPGTYTFTVTDTNGVTASQSITIPGNFTPLNPQP